MGLLEALTLIFVVLKLLGVIAWSWWLVFSPLIVSVVIALVYYRHISRKFMRDIDDIFGK